MLITKSEFDIFSRVRDLESENEELKKEINRLRSLLGDKLTEIVPNPNWDYTPPRG